MSLAAPSLSRATTYSPPGTTPVLVSSNVENTSVMYLEFVVFNATDNRVSIQNINAASDHFMSLGNNQYIAYLSTDFESVQELVISVKIHYTDNSETPLSDELYTITAPPVPVISETLRLDADDAVIAINYPSSADRSSYLNSANAGINYFLQYLDQDGNRQLITQFISMSAVTADDDDERYIFRITNLPIDTECRIAAQWVYVYRTNTFAGDVSNTMLIDATGSYPAPQDPSAVVSVDETTQIPIVTLTWSAPSFPALIENQGYRVYRRIGSNAYTAIVNLSASTFSYTDNGISLNQTYEYYIVGVTNNIESQESAHVFATIEDILPPTNLAVTAVPVTSAAPQVKLTWSPPSNVANVPVMEYLVNYVDNSGTGLTAIVPSTSSLEFVQDDLISGNTYVFNIQSKAYDNTISSTFSSIDYVAPIPGAVQNLSGTYSLSNNTVTLTWERASNFDIAPPMKYTVQQTGNGNTVTYDNISGLGLSETTNDALVPGNTYTFVVSSIPYIIGATPETSTIQLDIPLPDPVHSVVATFSKAGGMEVTWTPPTITSNIGGFNVYRKIAGANDDSYIEVGFVYLGTNYFSEPYFNDNLSSGNKLANGQTYVYKIRSEGNIVMVESTGALSNSIQVIIPADAPSLTSALDHSVETTINSSASNLMNTEKYNSVPTHVRFKVYERALNPVGDYALSRTVNVVYTGGASNVISTSFTNLTRSKAYKVEALIITIANGIEIEGDSVSNDPFVISGRPEITSAVINPDGTLSIEFMSMDVQPNGDLFPAFSSNELKYPLALVVASSEPTQSLIPINPSPTVQGLVFTDMGDAPIGFLGRHYKITYQAYKEDDPSVPVPLSFFAIAASNNHGTGHIAVPPNVNLSVLPQT